MQRENSGNRSLARRRAGYAGGGGMGAGRAIDRTVMGRVLAAAVLVGAAVLSLVAVAPAPVRAATLYYVGSSYGGPVRTTPDDAAGCTNSNNLTCTLRGALSLVASG